MRMPVVWAGVCLACLVLSGCSKSGDADEFPPMDFEGVKVDTPRLAKEFQEAAPQLQQRVNNAVTKVRYKQYLQAMMELDEVLKDPGLNDKQKKLISQVINQLKELVAKNPPRPA